MTIKRTRLEIGVELIPTNVEGVGGEDLTRDGELAADNSDNELKVRLDGVTETVVTEDQTQTLTNKDIDADTNTISNLETDNLKAGVLNTDLTVPTPTNTQVPSALAAKTYTDNVQTNLTAHINTTTGAHAATSIAVTPTGNLSSTNVQTALVELQGDINSINTNGVVGPASATDEAIARFDTTTGKLIQNSTVTMTDGGVIAGASIDADTNTITNIENADIKTGAAIARAKLASGTNTAVVHNNGSGVMTDSSDFTVGTNSVVLANTKHVEVQAATDSTTTGSNASLASFTAGKIRLTNVSLVSLANIPAGSNGQELEIVNRTGVAISVVDSAAASGTAANRILTGTGAPLTVANDSAINLTYDSTTARWQIIGGSGSGSTSSGINYILNPNGEVDTTGWATYADTAGTAPVDGTGGSANVTYTRTASSPLRGTGSFLFTKDAVNRQGQGFSYNFTIDPADQGKVLQGSFEYQIASGTFADNDLSVWIYDVTNGVMLQPAPYLIKNSGIIEKFPIEFQTAINSLSYRLIIHVGSTSAVAYTVKFDTFNVGPQAKLYGADIETVTIRAFTTGTGTYTPTPGTRRIRVRMVGGGGGGQAYNNDTAASTGGSSTFGSFLTAAGGGGGTNNIGGAGGAAFVSAPATGTGFIGGAGTSYGDALNTAGGNGGSSLFGGGAQGGQFSQVAGSNGTANSGAGGGGQGGGTLASGSGGGGAGGLDVIISSPLSASYSYAVGAGGAGVGSGGSGGSGYIEVTEYGLSASQVISSDAATNTVVMSAFKSTTQSIPNSAVTALTGFDAGYIDDVGGFNATTGQYTVRVPGKYRITSTLIWLSNATGIRQTLIVRSGSASNLVYGVIAQAATSDATGTTAIAVLDCKVGDIIYGTGYQTSGGALGTNVLANGTSLLIERISGPAQIMASDSVSASYRGVPPTGTLNTSTNAVIYTQKFKDTHNAYNTSTGEYTVPVSGTYSISGSFTISGTWVVAQIAYCYFSVDGLTTDVMVGTQAAQAAGTYRMTPAFTVGSFPLLAGQKIKIVSQSTGSALSFVADGAGFFSITRTGNY